MSSEYLESEIFCMGTNIIQRVYGFNARKTIKEVENEMKRLEALMNFYKDSSEIGILNSYGFEKEVKLSRDVFYIIKKAKYFSEISQGAFDISLAPVIELWGVFTKHERVPLEKEIKEKISLVSYNNLILNEGENTVKFSKENMKIDLGGIAKGYAADRATQIYKQNNVNAAFINLGGNVMVFGEKPDNSDWSVGVQEPFKSRGEIIGVANITNESVVTSGNYVRYFEDKGVKYHHIIDPRTGYPADSNLMSVTVISQNSMEGDALSTAAFVLGDKEGMQLIKNYGAKAIFITKDKKVKITSNMRQDFYLIEDNGFEYCSEVGL
ncbi:FAD:protein FMN transferase [Clostridium guangxiense]|uniref:FAD:protein FMN transferase n=1 Tax=Clostridium guangxiense TaxID=1662055 RepID=UPI001E2D2E18|nr:FAD:protein FMN transferase [Clostridium guangxiense]MCD2346557.1 FAD:protein FMN transferase [Clostridium guangxiense]